MQNRELNKVTDKNKVRVIKNETLYIVSTESMQGARETAYEILERLVMKKFTSLTEERLGDGKLRTCCLESDGGKQICYNYKRQIKIKEQKTEVTE